MTVVPKKDGNVAAVLDQSQARLRTVNRPIPKPGPNEIVVRNHASM
jgi:NADPH:quinone reductase-like Zn-dependent oxidoreductase